MADELAPRPPENRPAGAFSDPDLLRRIGSALVLAVLAVAATLYGGLPFALLWVAAGCIVLWEWCLLVEARHDVATLGIGMLAIAGATLLNDAPLVRLGLLLGGGGLLMLVNIPARRLWVGAGFAYAAAIALAPVMLRIDPARGLLAVLWLFAVVWGTDVGAYFAGRAIGGPKLWPRVSPKKTWAGFIGGTLVGTGLALALVRAFGLPLPLPLIAATYIIAALSQGGDLLESALKRRFSVKDASSLIPGHGGVMDRLDAFVVAALAALLLGGLRNGWNSAATGLLVW